MEATTDNRKKYWGRWTAYVTPLGVDPYLQTTHYEHRARVLSGFAARVRTGHYGRGRQIRVGTVISAVTAIGTTISLAKGINPTKMEFSDKFIPRLAQMFQGWRKEDPPIIKKLPVEADIPEFLSALGKSNSTNQLDKAIGDLTLIAFYYLLRVGEYTVKCARNNTKQTVQFRMQDVTFFRRDNLGQLRQLSRLDSDNNITTADSATLKLDNQKNGWKGVCIHQETNGNSYHCPVRALGRRFVHIRKHTADPTVFLSAFFVTNRRFDVTDNDIRKSVKAAAQILHYPS
jgi:hypothetical protein